MTCKQKWHTHVLENPFIEWVLFRRNNKVYRGAISFFHPPPSCVWNVDVAPAVTLNHKMTLAEKPWLMEHWDRRSLRSWHWECCDMKENSTASFKQAESIVLSQRTIGDSEDEVCHSGLRACEPSVIQTPWCAGLSVALLCITAALLNWKSQKQHFPEFSSVWFWIRVSLWGVLMWDLESGRREAISLQKQ